jgi:hypothetical protein
MLALRRHLFLTMSASASTIAWSWKPFCEKGAVDKGANL